LEDELISIYWVNNSSPFIIKSLIETINKQQTIADQEGKISVQANKLVEQSDKISKLKHKTTEQGWKIKEQYAEINALCNMVRFSVINIPSWSSLKALLLV
jgi:hypothetical protein